MIINAQNIRSMEVGFQTLFNRGHDSRQPEYGLIATEVPSNTSEENYGWIGQIPQMHEWVGERVAQNLSGYTYTIKNKPFENTVCIDRDEIEDDRYNVYAPVIQGMGADAKVAPDKTVFELFHKGFTEKGFDEVPFFSTKHPVGDDKKNTYSNLGTAALSQDSFLAARQGIMSLVGDKGKTLDLVPDLLVVPPALESAAKLILEADTINGTTNITKGMAKLKVSTKLAAYPTEWFLLCTGEFMKPFILQMRRKPVFTGLTRGEDPNVFFKKQYVYGTDGRWNAGYGFPQMAFGSTGKDAGGGSGGSSGS